MAVETAWPIDPPAASPAEPAEPSPEAPAIVIGPAGNETGATLAAPPLSVAMDPAARPIPSAPRHARKRRPALRLAVAASVAVACLIAFARFSDAHLSAPAILSLAAPSASGGHTAPLGTALPRVAALTLSPADAATLPPLLVTAALGTDDLVEGVTLPPSAGEQVTARTASIATAASEKAEPQATQAAVHAAAPRKPVAKPAASRSAAQRTRGEASRQEAASRGPILDFLSNLIP